MTQTQSGRKKATDGESDSSGGSLAVESLVDPSECDEHDPDPRALWTNRDGSLETACGRCGVKLDAELADVDWSAGDALPEEGRR